jgi:radical SAM superfamily enzyme YgiQ (UPF0313 family)
LKNPKWVRQFLSTYAETIGRPYYCNARPETVTDELATLLADTGCAALGIGIESGSERIRRDVLNRPMTDERIERAFNSAKTAGLKTWSFNMVGLPSESETDVASLIALNERCHPDFIRLSIFTPYPGTPMGSEVDPSDEHLSYFRPWTDLPPESVKLVSSWLTELQSHNRLWYTDTELLTLIGHS